MSVRRKSNWYVYFIAFAIAMAFAVVAIFAFRWYLFPEASNPTGLTPSGYDEEKFKPTKEHNFNSMIMMSDGAVDNPELFILVEYSAPENRMAIVLIPNGISVPTEGRTLPNVYAAQGGEKVVSVVEDAVKISIDSYAKIGRTEFINLVSLIGNVNYEIMQTVIIRDGSEGETLNVGTHRLAGESMFRLAMLAEYSEGESYRFSNIGQMFADLINQNYRSIDDSLMDAIYNNIIESAETNLTNLTEDKYKQYKKALRNTVEYGVSPAEYYVPFGEYTDDGGFIISENSITTIRQRSGLE